QLSHATPQLHSSPVPSRFRSRFRHWLAGSSSRKAESSLFPYGLLFHLPLLRTPSHDDALSFSYRPESACLARTFTSLSMHARSRTSARLQPRRDDIAEFKMTHYQVVEHQNSKGPAGDSADPFASGRLSRPATAARR